MSIVLGTGTDGFIGSYLVEEVEITGAITLVRDVVGWEPQYSFRDGIRAKLRDWNGSNE